MRSVTFTVYGKPQPKGAHTSFVPKRKDGSYVTRPDGAPVVVTKDSNDNQTAAQHTVMRQAIVAREQSGVGVWDGPVLVDRRFYFTRPAGHFGTGRNAKLLKEKAPAFPVTAADIDKLDRLLFDGLTGTLLKDDKQIVGGHHSKLYADGDDPPRIEVTVTFIEQRTVGVIQSVEQLQIAA